MPFEELTTIVSVETDRMGLDAEPTHQRVIRTVRWRWTLMSTASIIWLVVSVVYRAHLVDRIRGSLDTIYGILPQLVRSLGLGLLSASLRCTGIQVKADVMSVDAAARDPGGFFWHSTPLFLSER